MKAMSPSTQLWVAAWELLHERSDELFNLLTRDCKRLDLEAIHDLRVASRRLREGLCLFAACFPKRHLTTLRSRLKRLTRTLGTIRNTDEALHFFALLPMVLSAPANEAAEQLILALLTRRKEEEAELKKNLKEISPTALRSHFDQTCNNPLIFSIKAVDPLQPAGNFLKAAITERETPLRELYPQACNPENIAAQHRLRIAIKRFRYRMEYCALLTGAGYAELYARTKGFQEILGHLHDLDVFFGMVTEMVPDPMARQAMQELIGRRREELFAEFQRQDANCPVTSLGDRLRRLL